MPAPLKPSRRRKLPQAPVSTEPKGSKSRGPPPKLPPRTSIGSKTTPEASTNTYASNTRLSSSSRYPLQSYAIAGTANTESAAAAAAAAAAVPSTLSTSTSNTTAGAAANPTSSKRPTLAQHKQKASSPSLAAAATTIVVEPQNLDRRQKTVAALVAAEQEYGRKLAIFEAVFGKIARTPETFAPLRDLLLTAPPLADVCNTIIAELAPKINPTSTAKIGELFCAHASRLAVYSAFIGQVEAASLALEESHEDGTPVVLMVEECESDPKCENVSFLEYCRLPRQHLSQYVGRLEAVLAVTSEDHLDYNPLSEAIERVRAAVAQITSESQHLATLLNVLRVESRIPGTDLSELRAAPEELLKEGPLEWRGGGGADALAIHAQKKRLHCFLFSNMLIVTVPKAGVRAGSSRTYAAVDPGQLGVVVDPAVKRRSWGGAAGAAKIGVLDGTVTGFKLKGKAFMAAHDFEEVRPDRQALMELHAKDEDDAAEWLAAIAKMA